jgi:hypothetical protein
MRALKREWEYISEEDKGAPLDEVTVFQLNRLTLDQLAEVQNGLVQLVGSLAGDAEPRTLVFSGTQEVQILVYGVRGWRNFKDEDGNDIPFPTKGASRAERRRDDGGEAEYEERLKAALALIPNEVRGELAREIMGRTRLSKEERGNSVSRAALPAPGDARPALDRPESAAAH